MCFGLSNALPRIAAAAKRGLRLKVFHAGSCLLLGLALSGCATPPRADPARPIEYVFSVQADKRWQASGVFANEGNVISCLVTGQWSDAFSKYEAQGSPSAIRSHLGVNAPASGLIMRIGDQTNLVYFIGKETNIVAGGSGELKFRNNFSLPSGMSGQLTVRLKVAADTDEDGLSDYEEIHAWKTDPLRADSDGDGFSDLEEINDRLYRPAILPSAP